MIIKGSVLHDFKYDLPIMRIICSLGHLHPPLACFHLLLQYHGKIIEITWICMGALSVCTWNMNMLLGVMSSNTLLRWCH